MFAASRLAAPCCLLAATLACHPSEVDENADLCVSRHDRTAEPNSAVAEEPQQFAADEPLGALALASFGSTPIDSFTCEFDLDLDARTITVHTEIRRGRDTGLDIVGTEFAECTSPPIPAGEYTVVYADHEATLTVPDLREVICFEHASH